MKKKSEVVTKEIDEISPVIRVDYQAIFPGYKGKPVYDDLEETGPLYLNVSTLEHRLYWKQKDERYRVTGDMIFNDIRYDIQQYCGLRDLLAIKSQGIKFFRKYFNGKVVVGWKGIVNNSPIHNTESSLVPYIMEKEDAVILEWIWIGYEFDSRHIGLRRKESNYTKKYKEISYGGDATYVKEASEKITKDLTFPNIPKNKLAVIFDYQMFQDDRMRLCCKCIIWIISNKKELDSLMKDYEEIFLTPRSSINEWSK